MKKITTILLALSLLIPAQALERRSPDGNVVLTFDLDANGTPVYQLSYKGRPVILPSRLGMELVGQEDLMDGFAITGSETSTFDET